MTNGGKEMRQSLNQYYIFYTVAACGNLSSAAKQLYISQPAVSKAIAKLESDLGAQLLYRTTKGVQLTDSGEIIYKKLEIAFRAIEDGEEQLRINEEAGTGSISIGVSSTLCKYFLLPYLRQFIRENPHIKISISCQPFSKTIEALENGSINVGLVGNNENLENFSFHPIGSITSVFVASEEYLRMLRRQADNATEKYDTDCDLFAHGTLLLLEKPNITRQYVDRYLEEHKIPIGQMIEFTAMDLLIDFAKTGLGIACVNKYFVEKELEEGSLILLTTREPIPSRQIGIVTSDKAPFTRSMEKFIKGFTAFDAKW